MENDDECDDYEVSLNSYESYNTIFFNLPMIDVLLKSVCSLEVYEDVKFDILTIDADLFSWETPLETTFMELKHLSSMGDDLFTYDLLMSYSKD